MYGPIKAYTIYGDGFGADGRSAANTALILLRHWGFGRGRLLRALHAGGFSAAMSRARPATAHAAVKAVVKTHTAWRHILAHTPMPIAFSPPPHQGMGSSFSPTPLAAAAARQDCLFRCRRYPSA